jgi:hypothetical protein
MSVTMESPLSSQVFGSLDSLSPPPTPNAKRARHFFPSNASSPTPMFFPKSKSLFGTNTRAGLSPASEKENAERMQLQRLASRLPPCLQLKPRPTDITNRTARLRLSSRSSSGDMPINESRKMRITVDQILPLPLVFHESKTLSFKPVEESSVASIPELPSLSCSLSDSSKGSVIGSVIKPSVSYQAKLPSIKRDGMHRHIVKKRNSFVARSA